MNGDFEEVNGRFLFGMGPEGQSGRYSPAVQGPASPTGTQSCPSASVLFRIGKYFCIDDIIYLMIY